MNENSGNRNKAIPIIIKKSEMGRMKKIPKLP
jgi:hypothetical protein